jgi:hypothetical protein
MHSFEVRYSNHANFQCLIFSRIAYILRVLHANFQCQIIVRIATLASAAAFSAAALACASALAFWNARLWSQLFEPRQLSVSIFSRIAYTLRVLHANFQCQIIVEDCYLGISSSFFGSSLDLCLCFGLFKCTPLKSVSQTTPTFSV